jgi:hypothetical protein
MGRRGKGRTPGFEPPATDWSQERTMAQAEADLAESAPAAAAPAPGGAPASDLVCPCGSREFLLEAFLHVVDGRMKPVPVDVESLTCPACGREFEAIQLEDGRVVRGEFRGYAELDDD